MTDRCVMCGGIIPEGYGQVCMQCRNQVMKASTGRSISYKHDRLETFQMLEASAEHDEQIYREMADCFGPSPAILERMNKTKDLRNYYHDCVVLFKVAMDLPEAVSPEPEEHEGVL